MKKSMAFVWLSRLALLALIVLAAVLLLEKGDDWLDQISRMDWKPDLLSITGSILLLLLSYILAPIGWVWISGWLGCKSDSGELRAVWFSSQLGRYVPGKIWLFVGRAGYLKSTGISMSNAALAPVYELLHTSASVGLITLGALILFPNLLHSDTIRIAAAISGVCLLVLPVLHPVQKYIARMRFKGAESGIREGGFPFPPTGLSIRLILFYSFLWILRGISVFLWLTSIDVQSRGFMACIAVIPLSWFAGYIVFFVPGGIGVREATTVALLAIPGDTGPLLAAVIGHRLFLAIIEVILALVSARTVPFLRRKTADE